MKIYDEITKEELTEKSCDLEKCFFIIIALRLVMLTLLMRSWKILFQCDLNKKIKAIP